MAARRAALDVLVLAAGMGKRLRSKTIKLLHPVAGRPMVAHVLAAATELRPRQLITVVGHQAGSSVRISAPSAVTSTVCSNWAVRLRSLVTTVHLSGQMS